MDKFSKKSRLTVIDKITFHEGMDGVKRLTRNGDKSNWLTSRRKENTDYWQENINPTTDEVRHCGDVCIRK